MKAINIYWNNKIIYLSMNCDYLLPKAWRLNNPVSITIVIISSELLNQTIFIFVYKKIENQEEKPPGYKYRLLISLIYKK